MLSSHLENRYAPAMSAVEYVKQEGPVDFYLFRGNTATPPRNGTTTSCPCHTSRPGYGWLHNSERWVKQGKGYVQERHPVELTMEEIRQVVLQEIKALKLELASLRGLVQDLLTELRSKPTLTALQPVVPQAPDAAPAPPGQQQKEKRKRTTSGESSPTQRAPKTVRAVSPPVPLTSPTPPPPPDNENTEMQLVRAAEADTALVASDGFSDLIGKRALRRRRRSTENLKCNEEEVVETKDTASAESGRGADSADAEARETVKEGDKLPDPKRTRSTVRQGRGCQKRATWAEVIAAGGVNIPVVFDLLGLNLDKGVHCSRNRRQGTSQPENGRTGI
ncbi:hypothetical protein FPQ18DRAFT_302604 [Pyronema domesticum]|nr:hypothetical protein FPQ18DRAFT_302604 [Pyronema domesticum]